MQTTLRKLLQRVLPSLLVLLFLGSLSRAQSPALAGIAHVAFRVSSVEKSRAFYQSLGFEQAFEFGEAGKTDVSYIKINDRQFVELYQRKDESQPLGLLHVCFEADDLNAVHDEYVKRGLTPSPVRKARAGNLLSTFKDPEGQLLEYTQYLPGSLHSEQKGKHLGEKRISHRIQQVTESVKDPQAEAEFYISKLGFTLRPDAGKIAVRLPGNSGQEIAFESMTAEAKPQILFQVQSVSNAAAALRARGLSVQASSSAASVTDPDGTVILLAPSPGPAKTHE